MGSPSSIAQAMSKRLLEICASRMPLQQIISSINESMHNKEKDGKEVQTDPYLIEFVKRAQFKHASRFEGCQEAASECKRLPDSGDFRFRYPELKFIELSRPRSEHVDFFIPSELLVGKKLHPLIALLLSLEKLKALQFSNLQREVTLVSCLVFFILPLHKT